jgi:signal transduction histidine kinase
MMPFARSPASESWADDALSAVTAAIIAVVAVVLAVVILPAALMADARLEDDARVRVLAAAESLRAGGTARSTATSVTGGSRVGQTVGGVRLNARDVAGARSATYVRSGHTTHRAWAVASIGDGRLVTSRRTRRPVIEAAGLIAILLATVLATLCGSWIIQRPLRIYRRRVGVLAEATQRIARGERGVRTAVDGSDEIGMLSGHVDAMAERLEALEQARTTFIAKVSHDLRTPLTVIRGYAYTLGRYEGSPVARERLRRIELETDRLAALVDDLMTVSEASAGGLRLVLSEQDAAATLDEVAERLTGLAEHRNVRILRLDGPGSRTVRADRRRLVQIVTNLATNAINHAPAGTSVVLGVAVVAGRVEIYVADEGPGIDPRQAERLLEPFERGEESLEGTGLGLAIARDLVAAHGGRLQFRAAEPRGTRAVVSLPVRPAAAT